MDPERVRFWDAEHRPLEDPGEGLDDVRPVRAEMQVKDPARRALSKAAGGGPAPPNVEVLDGEVRALRVAHEDSPFEGQALAGRVGDGVAQPGVPQERGVGDLVVVGFGHVHVDVFGDPAPMSLRPGQTRMVWGMLVVTGPACVYSSMTGLGGAPVVLRVDPEAVGQLLRTWAPAKLSITARNGGECRKSPSSRKRQAMSLQIPVSSIVISLTRRCSTRSAILGPGRPGDGAGQEPQNRQNGLCLPKKYQQFSRACTGSPASKRNCC